MEDEYQRALALQTAGRHADAEALYRRILDYRPDSVRHNLAAILRTTGRLDEAEAMLRAALAINPNRPNSRFSLGMVLVQAGAYAEGWAMLEARRQVLRLPMPPSLPEWRGEALAGRRLIVVGEQGFGDQILLARFAGLVDGAVTLAVSRVLLSVLGDLPVDLAYPAEGWDALAGDCWAYAGSIPHLLGGLTPDDAPRQYIHRPSRGGGGLGLMLEGGALTGSNPLRTPPPEVAARIRGLAEFTDLSPQATGAADFAATADIIAGLDAVITVDTSVAHLAGAMGKPCWVMMGHPAIDWHTRWRDDGSDWYPRLRTLRQPVRGDWASLVGEVARVVSGA